MSEEIKSAFEILNNVDVSDKAVKKNGLTYLSWAWAWGEVKKRFRTPLSPFMNGKRLSALLTTTQTAGHAG